MQSDPNCEFLLQALLQFWEEPDETAVLYIGVLPLNLFMVSRLCRRPAVRGFPRWNRRYGTVGLPAPAHDCVGVI